MKIAHFLLVTLFGLLVFGLLMTFAANIPAAAQYAVRGGLLVLFGGLWWMVRSDGSFGKMRPVFFAYFTITAALTISYYAADPIVAALHSNGHTPMGISLTKAVQSAIIVVTIIAMMLLTGRSLGSLYIRKGRLLLGVSLGLLGMAVFIALTFLPGGPGLKLASLSGKIAVLVPALALFVFANAAMEELLYRGALLQPYEALIGRWGALASTTLVFALSHVQVTYTSQLPMFLASVLVLGFLWGLLMQKSKGIWGSVLFHAGADVAIILPFYQGLVGS